MRKIIAPRSPSPLILASPIAILALAGSVWLWAKFGGLVFFEAIRVGFVVCFG
ncbi:MAG: hypothetical protein ACLPKB_13115 [Xanthobacteraceae bacterium]